MRYSCYMKLRKVPRQVVSFDRLLLFLHQAMNGYYSVIDFMIIQYSAFSIQLATYHRLFVRSLWTKVIGK